MSDMYRYRQPKVTHSNLSLHQEAPLYAGTPTIAVRARVAKARTRTAYIYIYIYDIYIYIYIYIHIVIYLLIYSRKGQDEDRPSPPRAKGLMGSTLRGSRDSSVEPWRRR